MKKNILFGGISLVGLSVLLGGCQTIKSMEAQFVRNTHDSVNGRFINEADKKIQTKVERSAFTDLLDSLKVQEDGKEVGYNVQQRAESEQQQKSQLGLSAQDVETRQLLMDSVQELTGKGAHDLNAYLQSIADGLLTHWPYKMPEPGVKVIVVKANKYWAGMSSQNVLRVNIGVLVNADSEDEVAAIIAHELGHALLGHKHVTDQKEIENKMMAVGFSTIASLAAEKSGDSGSVAARNFLLSGYALRKLNNNILYPAWGRHLEDEADLLAVDLLFKAGYDWERMKPVLERVADQDKKEEQNTIKVEEQHKLSAEKLAASGDINAAMESSLAQLSSQLNRSFKSLSGEHRSAEERSTNLQVYIGREYLSEDFPPAPNKKRFEKNVWGGAGFQAIKKSVYGERAKNLLQQGEYDKAFDAAKKALDGANDSDPSARYVMYQVRKQQGQDDKALENLEIARQSKIATVEIYDALVAEYRARENWSRALQASVDRFENLSPSFSAHEHFPLHVELLLRAGHQEEAQVMIQECEKLGATTYQRCQESLHMVVGMNDKKPG